jgi:hypothetical protein
VTLIGDATHSMVRLYYADVIVIWLIGVGPVSRNGCKYGPPRFL